MAMPKNIKIHCDIQRIKLLLMSLEQFIQMSKLKSVSHKVLEDIINSEMGSVDYYYLNFKNKMLDLFNKDTITYFDFFELHKNELIELNEKYTLGFPIENFESNDMYEMDSDSTNELPINLQLPDTFSSTSDTMDLIDEIAYDIMTGASEEDVNDVQLMTLVDNQPIVE